MPKVETTLYNGSNAKYICIYVQMSQRHWFAYGNAYAGLGT